MKKIIYSFLLLLFLNACAGYKPIFTSTNLQFEITNYSVEGNKTLGNKIYDKLNRLSKSNKNDENQSYILEYPSINTILLNEKSLLKKIRKKKFIISENMYNSNF